MQEAEHEVIYSGELLLLPPEEVIDFLGCIRARVEQAGRILSEKSPIHEPLLEIAVVALDPVGLKLPVEPINASLAAFGKVQGKDIAIEASVEVVEVGHHLLVFFFLGEFRNDFYFGFALCCLAISLFLCRPVSLGWSLSFRRSLTFSFLFFLFKDRMSAIDG